MHDFKSHKPHVQYLAATVRNCDCLHLSIKVQGQLEQFTRNGRFVIHRLMGALGFFVFASNIAIVQIV